MNPIQIIKTLKSNGNSPEQIFNQLIGDKSNPIIVNLMNMAKNKDSKGIETFARNFCNEKGIDFDKEFSSFMNNFK